MERLPTIPTPPSHWWRLFCVRFLPFAMFTGGAVAAAVLWQHQGGGRTFVGIGDGARASVNAPQAGSVVEFLVQPYAEVRQGDPVAVLRGYDPRGDVDRMRLRLEVARLQSAPSVAEESAVDFERLRLELARVRSEVASTRVRLDFATREVDRLEPLFRERLIAEDTFELSRGAREMHAAEVREKERLMKEVEARLQALEVRQSLAGSEADAAASVEDDLDSETGSVIQATGSTMTTLVAPMDGTVGSWLRRAGEFVVEGEPLIIVHARQSERIIGYLRQPIGFEPEAGMAVQVARRTFPTERFPSVIRHVGAHFESITNALAFLRDGSLLDVGLPVVVEVPLGYPIRPGEMVDVVIPTRRGALVPSLAQRSIVAPAL